MFENMLVDYQKKWVDEPGFDNDHRVHNWRRYVPSVFIASWASLSVETRQAIIIMAEAQSDAEEWD